MTKFDAYKKQQGTALDTDIVTKANLLQQKLHSKLIKLVVSDLSTEEEKAPMQRQQDQESHRRLGGFIRDSFTSFDQNFHQQDLSGSGQEESKAA